VAVLRANQARASIEAEGGVTDCDAWYRLGGALALFDRGTRISVAAMSVDTAQCFSNALHLALGPQDGGRAFHCRRDWVANALYGLARVLEHGDMASVRARLLGHQDCVVGALAACDGERADLWKALARTLPIDRSEDAIISRDGHGFPLRQRAGDVAHLLTVSPTGEAEAPGNSAAVGGALIAASLPSRVTRRECLLKALALEPHDPPTVGALATTMASGFRDTVLLEGQRMTKRDVALLAVALDRRVSEGWRALADTMAPGDDVQVPELDLGRYQPATALLVALGRVPEIHRQVLDALHTENARAAASMLLEAPEQSDRPVSETQLMVTYEDCLALAETFDRGSARRKHHHY
jgi:hypothetical protein